MINPTTLAALVDFQLSARDALAGAILRASEYLEQSPSRRGEIVRSAGVMLLESPTGSGKTLTLGRTLESVRGRMSQKCVWFWFAPFVGLVAQTRDALAEQCPSLRLRNLATDRETALLRDGDLFIQTWAAVAKTNKESLKVRRAGGEGPMSLDLMLAALRADGVRVGVVIDEAHLNFGVNARAAAAFYLDVLQPDFTLLATATPNDEALEEFERLAGVRVESRVVVARDEVVRAGLNKRGLRLGVISFREDAARLIDPETAALTAGWEQHKRIKQKLEDRGIKLTPLMLVQVEDQKKGEADPVRRVEKKLQDLGIPNAAIAVHTSGEPDPEFHTLAYDDSKEVLVFKVAVATGFDAPRAWTLVSVRPNRGKSFGLQIVGRIMRVHPAVRPLHGQDDLLDRGYVFLTNGEEQGGLEAAATELRAVRSSIESIADELAIVEFSNTGQQNSRIGVPTPPQTPEERTERLVALIDAGILPAHARNEAVQEQDRLIASGEWRRSLQGASLFDDLPLMQAPMGASRRRSYPLRTDLSVPTALLQEILPPPDVWDDAIATNTARALFRQRETPVTFLNRVRGRVSVSLRDLFLAEAAHEEVLQVRMSDARIAEVAQTAFEFNDQLDPRRFKRALIEQFAIVCHEQGREYTDQDLRRALDLFAMARPQALTEALREAQTAYVRVVTGPPLPELLVDESTDIRPARLGGWGVFPQNMNKEERAFAELLDADTTGRVMWWLRLQESALWAPTLILPNGRRFFPDFAVGVTGRNTPDSVALVEIKDDGSSGRLHSDTNLLKIRVAHRDYRKVHWTVREDGIWTNAELDSARDRIITIGRFNVDTLAA
jgi:type III restriction enzyme